MSHVDSADFRCVSLLFHDLSHFMSCKSIYRYWNYIDRNELLIVHTRSCFTFAFCLHFSPAQFWVAISLGHFLFPQNSFVLNFLTTPAFSTPYTFNLPKRCFTQLRLFFIPLALTRGPTQGATLRIICHVQTVFFWSHLS